MSWKRVTHHNPCPICEKPDWCTIGSSGICCMRLESDHPVKNGGWMHFFNTGQSPPQLVRGPPIRHIVTPDFKALLETWSKETTDQVSLLAVELGVDKQALIDLGACYSKTHRAMAFPMFDAEGTVLGIRLRNTERKWAVLGSKSGLFIPFPAIVRLSVKMVLICEGPTDTSAALTLGLFAIGRPACVGCEEMVSQVLRDITTQEAVVCYDNDGPGIRGADKLCAAIKCRVSRFVPPCKDLRLFVAKGGTRAMLTAIINSCIRTRGHARILRS